MVRIGTAIAALLLAITTATVAQPIGPHKDGLFAYPALLREERGGAYRVVDYSEQRDIDRRDEIPERRVQQSYVSLGVRRQQREVTTDGLAHFAVGRTEGARVIVVYVHGQGGNRRQGIDDFTFGGNFNRVKNLVAGSDGLYLSPDVPDFGSYGARRIMRLAEGYRARSPHARIILACGSAGGAICWRAAGLPEAQGILGGLVLLGSHWDDSFFKSSAFRARVPVLLAHGSRDKVFAVERQEAFFEAILGRDGKYPVRFVRFESGTHGTPIRMVDWRETLNWMLSR